MEGCQCGGGRVGDARGGRVGDARGVKCGRVGGDRGVIRRRWRMWRWAWWYVEAEMVMEACGGNGDARDDELHLLKRPGRRVHVKQRSDCTCTHSPIGSSMIAV